MRVLMTASRDLVGAAAAAGCDAPRYGWQDKAGGI